MLYKALSLLACIVLLAGCVNREAADAKLARGCASGIKAFIADPEKEVALSGPENVKVGPSSLGDGYREVHLTYIVDDGWYKEEKNYSCTFQESFGIFGMSHNVVVHLADLGDNRYIGNKDGVIHGEMEEHVKLTKAVSQGLLQ